MEPTTKTQAMQAREAAEKRAPGRKTRGPIVEMMAAAGFSPERQAATIEFLADVLGDGFAQFGVLDRPTVEAFRIKALAAIV